MTHREFAALLDTFKTAVWLEARAALRGDDQFGNPASEDEARKRTEQIADQLMAEHRDHP